VQVFFDSRDSGFPGRDSGDSISGIPGTVYLFISLFVFFPAFAVSSFCPVYVPMHPQTLHFPATCLFVNACRCLPIPHLKAPLPQMPAPRFTEVDAPGITAVHLPDGKPVLFTARTPPVQSAPSADSVSGSQSTHYTRRCAPAGFGSFRGVP